MNCIENFYTAFKNQDAATMVSFYHPDVVFEDPAFGILQGERACNMWRMLIASQKGKDFDVSFSNIKCDDSYGSAHWEARYIFSKTGRKVYNKIEAQFEIREGLIHKHIDNFNLHSWAGQALGFKGWIMGGTKFFKKKLNAQTNAMLDKFEASR